MHPILTLTAATKAPNSAVPEEISHAELPTGTDDDNSFAAVFDVTAEKFLPKTATAPVAEEATPPLPESDADTHETLPDESASEVKLAAVQAMPDEIKGQIANQSRFNTKPQKTGFSDPSAPSGHQMPKDNAVPAQSAQNGMASLPTKTVETPVPAIVQGKAEPASDAVLPTPHKISNAPAGQQNTLAQQLSQALQPSPKQSELPQSTLLSLQAKSTITLPPAETSAPIASSVSAIRLPKLSKLPNTVSAAMQPTSLRRINPGRNHPELVAATPSTTIKGPTSAPLQWNSLQPPTTIASTETIKSNPALEPDFLTAPRIELTNTTTTAQTSTIPTRPDLPHHMARQIAEALQHMPNRPVEITLSPEELGRVRLGVSTSEGNIMVSVLAERPETSELMRRHISVLETAFQELGYSDISFSFAGGDSAQADGEDSAQGRPNAPLLTSSDSDAEITQLHLNAAPISGVDIRL